MAQLLAKPERAATQGLVARPGRDRQQVGQHAGGDAVGQQRGQVRLQLIQLRGRAAIRGPHESWHRDFDHEADAVALQRRTRQAIGYACWLISALKKKNMLQVN